MLLQSAFLVWQLFLSPTEAAPVGLELDVILREWCAASQRIETFDAGITQIEYDLTLEIEKRSTGWITYLSPGQLKFQSQPDEIKPGTSSRRLNASGTPFQLKPGRSALWIRNSTELLNINDQWKTYQRYPLEMPTSQTQGWFHNQFKLYSPCMDPIPLLFNLKENQLRRDFSFNMVKCDCSSIWLSGTPRTATWRSNFVSVDFILDRQTFFPKAIKYVDSVGTRERVVVLSSKDNSLAQAVRLQRIVMQLFLLAPSKTEEEKSLFHPNLYGMGYREVSPFGTDPK